MEDVKIVEKAFRAELHVCKWKLGRFPEISSFIEGVDRREYDYSKIDIKYPGGQSPTLKLFDEKHVMVDEVRIDEWDKKTILKYLDLKLEAKTNQRKDEL